MSAGPPVVRGWRDAIGTFLKHWQKCFALLRRVKADVCRGRRQISEKSKLLSARNVQVKRRLSTI